MSTTNDPRAPYGEAWTGKPKNRLLSVQEMMMGNMQAMDVADFYESLVSSGELITKADTATIHAPLLSDSQRSFIISKHVWKDDKFGKALRVADEIRDFYENLISSGELITKADHERLYKEALDRVFGPKR